MITIEKATFKDAEALHVMQIRSFLPLFERYKDEETNPACEPIENILNRISDPSRGFYKILKDGVLVGGIGVKQITSEILKIGPVFIDPAFQNQKIAQTALLLVEALFPAIVTFQLATIVQEKGNIYLYEKLGYVATGEIKNINPALDIVFFTKPGKREKLHE